MWLLWLLWSGYRTGPASPDPGQHLMQERVADQEQDSVSSSPSLVPTDQNWTVPSLTVNW